MVGAATQPKVNTMKSKATMQETCKFLGTPLVLHKGQRVYVMPASNLPQGGYFAYPVRRRSDQPYFTSESAMHVTNSEISFT
jgi:hypothetical protein